MLLQPHPGSLRVSAHPGDCTACPLLSTGRHLPEPCVLSKCRTGQVTVAFALTLPQGLGTFLSVSSSSGAGSWAPCPLHPTPPVWGARCGPDYQGSLSQSPPRPLLSVRTGTRGAQVSQMCFGLPLGHQAQGKRALTPPPSTCAASHRPDGDPGSGLLLARYSTLGAHTGQSLWARPQSPLPRPGTGLGTRSCNASS